MAVKETIQRQGFHNVFIGLVLPLQWLSIFLIGKMEVIFPECDFQNYPKAIAFL